jgi:hydroxyacylglutathione hydrolase
MEITPGIHLIPGIRGANAYLALNGDKVAVIDCGMPGNAPKITAYIRSLGKKEADVDLVIFTHSDIDHTGSAAELKKLTGAKLTIHPGDAPALAGLEEMKNIKGPLGFLFKLIRPMLRFQPVMADIILDRETEIADLRIIHTPGHTKGSICLLGPAKTIFVGDALRSDSRGDPLPARSSMTADAAMAKKSLAAIAELDFDICLPGHGAPIIGNAAARVRKMAAEQFK